MTAGTSVAMPAGFRPGGMPATATRTVPVHQRARPPRCSRAADDPSTLSLRNTLAGTSLFHKGPHGMGRSVVRYGSERQAGHTLRHTHTDRPDQSPEAPITISGRFAQRKVQFWRRSPGQRELPAPATPAPGRSRLRGGSARGWRRIEVRSRPGSCYIPRFSARATAPACPSSACSSSTSTSAVSVIPARGRDLSGQMVERGEVRPARTALAPSREGAGHRAADRPTTSVDHRALGLKQHLSARPRGGG
jgi:hypothetical protein